MIEVNFSFPFITFWKGLSGTELLNPSISSVIKKMVNQQYASALAVKWERYETVHTQTRDII